MPTELTAPFTIDRWDAHPDGGTPEGGPETAYVELAKTYAGGDVDGTATGHALTAQGPGGASYVAQERIVGTVLGRAGSLVVEHGASAPADGTPVQFATVVPGSGTGALAGIGGTGVLEHGLLTLQVTGLDG